MDISRFLARVLGLYMVIISIAMFANMRQFGNLVTALVNDPSLLFTIGFFTLLLGLALVVSHNLWQWNWRIIITIIAWLVVFKGVCLIFHPQYIIDMSNGFLRNQTLAHVVAAIDFIIGLALCYFGFKREGCKAIDCDVK